jgi:plastocyanin
MLVIFGGAGCGTQQAEKAPAASQSAPQSESQPAEETKVAQTTPKPATDRPQEKPTGSTHRIILTNQRCIEFEPHWTNVAVGQSVTWHSELKSPLTVHVTPGVFDKQSFVVRPGATVTSGPARKVGEFSFWTEPAACRNTPRGGLTAGPGVVVRESFVAGETR